MKAAYTVLLALIMSLIVIEQVGGVREAGWDVWINPRRETGLPGLKLEVAALIPGHTMPNAYADDDGGYTLHILMKKGPQYYKDSLSTVDYNTAYAFIHRLVSTWNASFKFVADNYEWGSHLSKLRLKLYENASSAPRIDIIIDATLPRCNNGLAAGCAYFPGGAIRVEGGLYVLSHELGHALGLGHEVGYDVYGYTWRGWGVGGGYPSDYSYGPRDTFALYGLAVRWSALKNSTPGQPLSPLPGNMIISYDDVAGVLGPLYGRPGEVTAYIYPVIREDGRERPIRLLANVYEGIYGEDLCFKWLIGNGTPIVRVFDNGTAFALHSLDIRLALLDRVLEKIIGKDFYSRLSYHYPLKFFKNVDLNEIYETASKTRNNTLLIVRVIDGLEPAWEYVSGVSYRDGGICLERLREKVLIEAQYGRAYRVVGVDNTELVVADGWSYRDVDGSYWVLRGSHIYFKPVSYTFSTSEGVRYVWRDVNETFKVDGPIDGGEMRDRFWRRQYLVEVDSPYHFEGVGWYDEGATALLKPSEELIDLGNGTRIIFKGFTGYNSTEIKVDRHLKLKPVWERMYRLDTISRYVFSEEGRYFKDGETVFTLMPRGQDFGNGTRVELANITAYSPSGEVVAAWDGKLGGDRYGLLQFTVDRPLRIMVDWNVYHRLTVTSPVNSYETWVLNGTVHKINLPERKLVGGDTLMVLKQVRVDGKPYQGLEITVTSPASVEAVYQRRLVTTFMVDAGGGYLVEPEEVVLTRDGEVEVYKPPFTYLGEGVWRVSRVVYLGGDVAVDATIELNIAGMRTLPSRLREVKVTVVDIIGIPVPYASITGPNTGGVTDASGTATIPAIPPWDLTVEASHILGRGGGVIRMGEDASRITAGISPYTIALLTTIALVGVVVWRGKVLRRRLS